MDDDELTRPECPPRRPFAWGCSPDCLAVAGCSDPAPGNKSDDPALKASMEKSMEIYKSKTQASRGNRCGKRGRDIRRGEMRVEAPSRPNVPVRTVATSSGRMTLPGSGPMGLAQPRRVTRPTQTYPTSTPASCPMNVLPIIALASLLAVAPPDNEPARPEGAGLHQDRRLTATTRSRPVIAAVRELGAEGGFVVDATEDAAAFTPENLARYRADVFLNTSGEVFDDRQKAAFQGFIRAAAGWRPSIRGSPPWKSGPGTLPWSAA